MNTYTTKNTRSTKAHRIAHVYDITLTTKNKERNVSKIYKNVIIPWEGYHSTKCTSERMNVLRFSWIYVSVLKKQFCTMNDYKLKFELVDKIDQNENMKTLYDNIVDIYNQRVNEAEEARIKKMNG